MGQYVAKPFVAGTPQAEVVYPQFSGVRVSKRYD